MAVFHAKTPLDRAFEIGLLFKAIDGLTETLGGLFFLFIRPDQVSNWVASLTAHELSTDPHDFVATHLVHWAHGFTKGSAIFAALYLLSHGLVKVILVFEILREHLWAYIGLIVLTGGFIIYQLIHIFQKPTFGFILLTVFDVVIVALTVKEYGRQRQRLGDHHSAEAGE